MDFERTNHRSCSSLAGKTWRLYRSSEVTKFAYTQRSTYEAQAADFLRANATLWSGKQPGSRGVGDPVAVVKMFRMRDGVPASDGPCIVLGGLGVVPTAGTDDGADVQDDDHFGLVVLSSIGSQAGNNGGFPNAQEFSVPCILTRGQPKFVQVLLSWFEETFDMSIAPMTLTPQQMVQFTGNCAVNWMDESERDASDSESANGTPARRRKLNDGSASASLDDQKPLELSYALPRKVADGGLDRVAVSIDARTLAKLRDAAERADSDAPGTHLIDLVSTHFSNTFRLPPELMSLTHAGTPLAYISADGRLKPYANPVLVLEMLYNATW